MLFNLVPVNICSSVYSTPVYVLPYTAYYTVLSKIMILFYVFTKSIDLRILARDTELYQQVLESVRLTS